MSVPERVRLRRRSLLALLAAGAGCAGSDPTPTPSPTPRDLPARFRRNLRLAGYEVVSLDAGESGGSTSSGETRGPTTLVYRVETASRSAVESSVRSVASSFASVVGAGWEPGRLEATVRGPDGVLATFGVEAAWARAFNAGEITAGEYGERIAATVDASRQTTSSTPSADTSTAGLSPTDTSTDSDA